MNHRQTLCLMAMGLFTGCSMCQDKWDYAQPTKGSAPVPYNQTTSRAGSAFTPEGPIATSDPTDAPNMPAAPEELPSRQRETEEPADSLTRQPNAELPKYR